MQRRPNIHLYNLSTLSCENARPLCPLVSGYGLSDSCCKLARKRNVDGEADIHPCIHACAGRHDE